MQNTNSATLTHEAQCAILRKHLNAFVKAQAKATEALRAINEIALCENEGNPLPCALIGNSAVVGYSWRVLEGGCSYTFKLSLDDTLKNARKALETSAYWASA
jgi:hypothetical protein